MLTISGAGAVDEEIGKNSEVLVGRGPMFVYDNY